MMKGLGLDLCQIARMKGLVAQGRFLERYFTESERAYILGKNKAAAQTAAGMYAAKEAFLKAAGTGLAGAALREIEVVHSPAGQPGLRLYGRAAALAQGCACLVTITHEANMAAAVVILQEQ